MAKLIIPSPLIGGFKQIAILNESQINELASYLRSMEVGTKFDDIDKFLNSQLGVRESTAIVRTIISFVDLLDGEDTKHAELAHDLRESAEQSLEEAEPIILDSLEFNLIKIFENLRNFRLTTKAFNLLIENSNAYVEGKIISDIRLIFNDNLTESDRSAVILHQLHLTVQNKRDKSDLIVTLDGADLKKLKELIDRALLKEDIIKEDYDNIHFIK